VLESSRRLVKSVLVSLTVLSLPSNVATSVLVFSNSFVNSTLAVSDAPSLDVKALIVESAFPRALLAESNSLCSFVSGLPEQLQPHHVACLH
jgi:hypothetical protein